MTNNRFRSALRLNINDFKKTKSKKELSTLMRIAGYRREAYDPKTGQKIKWKKNQKLNIRNISPSQKQLDFALQFVHAGKQTVTKKEYFKLERYEKHYVRRATENFYYKGRLYKRGQFLPKGVSDD